jgi:cobalt-zinc-cadmium efflux system outer membrane protein
LSRLDAFASLGVIPAALLVAGSSWARDISFPEARAAAEQLAPDVQLAEQRVPISNAEVDVAGALNNPTLTVSTAHQTARLGTSLAVPLPLFGQRATAMRAARADADAIALDVSVVRRESRWAATIAWIDLWESQERAQVLEFAAQDSERLFQIASEKFDAGTGPRLDVIRTKGDRARSAAEAEAARRLVSAAAARLAPWIGASPGGDLTATGTPGYPANVSVTIERLEQRLSDHPTLRRDRAEVIAAQARIQSEQRLRAPMVSPQLTVNQFDPTLPGPDVIIGLSLDLPVLSLRGGAIARAQARRTLAELVAAVDERRLHADLLDAYRRTEGANAKLHAFRELVLPALKEARTMTEEGYQLGRVDLIRLLDAQRALLESRLAAAEAEATWGRAVADLEKAAGADFRGDGTHAP